MVIWTYILFLCLSFPVSIAKIPYQPKEATLYEKNVTWNEAYEYCKAMGQTLLSLNESSYNTAVEIMMGKGILKQAATVGTFWIGLHTPDLQDPMTKRWTSTCQHSNFSQWAAGQPKDGLCVYASVDRSSRQPKFDWITDDCFRNKRPFVCEQKMDQCFYESYNLKYSNTEKSTLFESVSENVCKTRCLTYTSPSSGKPCWAFNYRIELSKCRMLVTWDPFESDGNQEASIFHRLYIKRCVRAQLGSLETAIPNTVSNTSVPITDCSNNNQQTTTDRKLTTENTAVNADTVTMVTESTTLSAIPTTNIEYNTKETTKAANINCDCNCTSKSTTDLIISMKAILENIRVDKHKTSLAVRKLYSASDDRTSSKGMGCVAIAFLSIMAVAIVLGDFDKFFKYVKKKRFNYYETNRC